MSKASTDPRSSGQYSLGPDIPWRPYHGQVKDYRPKSYNKIHEYNHVHEYDKIHEYNHIREYKYREYKPTYYQPVYRPYKLNLRKKERQPSKPVPSRPPVRKRVKKQYGVLYVCYNQPMGPDIKVKDYKYEEYQAGTYHPTYHEYRTRTEPYIDQTFTPYQGSVHDYVLTPYNHYPFRNYTHGAQHDLDENSNELSKENTRASLSKVHPVVYAEPDVYHEPEAINEERPQTVEEGPYYDPSPDNPPFEEEDIFAPVVISDPNTTPLPPKEPTPQPPDDEDEEEEGVIDEPPVIVAAAPVKTGGHVAPVKEETPVPEEQHLNSTPEPDDNDSVVEAPPMIVAAAPVQTGGHTAPVTEATPAPEEQHQETSTDPATDPEPVDNDPTVAPVVVAAAASTSNNDVAPAQQTPAPEDPVDDSGRWSALTTHGGEPEPERSLTPVDPVVAGAVVGSTVASQPEPVQQETAAPEPKPQAPVIEEAVPEAEAAPVVETAAPEVEAAPVVAAAAVVAESSAPQTSTVPASSTSRLPPEVVANIEAYNTAHSAEQSAVGSVKRTLGLMY